MITRIKSIKRIGNFKNLSHQKVEAITFIYGLNGYGKSTLGDIFRALAACSIDIIRQRETIDSEESENNQEAHFGYSIEGTDKEQEICFRNGAWDKSDFPYNIEVFDSQFIAKNVFTGLSISRANRESLTNLILGEENVELAEEIAELKKTQNITGQALSELSSTLEQQLNNADINLSLDEFQKVKKPPNKDKIGKQEEALQAQRKKLIKTLDESNNIINLSEPIVIQFQANLGATIKALTSLLAKDFQRLNEKALDKVNEHIQEHFKTHDGYEEQWLKKGVLVYTKSNSTEGVNCPFCGQNLKDARQLISTYHSLFSRTYQDFCNSLEGDLDVNLSNLTEYRARLRKLKDWLKINTINFGHYRDYFEEEFIESIDATERQAAELEKPINTLEQLLTQTLIMFEKLVQKKLQKPFKSVKTNVRKIDQMTQKQQEILKQLKRYNSQLNKIITRVKELKQSLKRQGIQKKLINVEGSLTGLQIQKERRKLDGPIKKLDKLKKKRETLEGKIKIKQSTLATTNDEFVQKYFDIVSELFNTFGADDFKIEKNFTRRGNQPVYGFTIKFRGKEISEGKISSVFSDADRRALALSIFLAKLKSKTSEQFAKTIVVLDDPVTSFDDNRVSHTIMEIHQLIPACRQLFVLTHYRNFLTDLCSQLRGSCTPKILKIERDRTQGSSLQEVSDVLLEFDEYSKKINTIEQFADGANLEPEPIRQNIRIMIQKELEWRYRPIVKNIEYEGLGTLIQKLRDSNAIEENLATELFRINSATRDDHHDIQEFSPEDTRSIAKSALELVFTKLNPYPENENEDD